MSACISGVVVLVGAAIMAAAAFLYHGSVISISTGQTVFFGGMVVALIGVFANLFGGAFLDGDEANNYEGKED